MTKPRKTEATRFILAMNRARTKVPSLFRTLVTHEAEHFVVANMSADRKVDALISERVPGFAFGNKPEDNTTGLPDHLVAPRLLDPSELGIPTPPSPEETIAELRSALDAADDEIRDLVAKLYSKRRAEQSISKSETMRRVAEEMGTPTPEEEEKPKIDEFHKHEVMHLASVLGDMVDLHFVAHAYVQSEPDVLDLVEHIGDKLAELYQLVGGKDVTTVTP